MGRLAGQPGMESEWPIIIMACHDKLLAGREACGYSQDGKEGRGDHSVFGIISSIGYTANKPQIRTLSTAFDVLWHTLHCSRRH